MDFFIISCKFDIQFERNVAFFKVISLGAVSVAVTGKGEFARSCEKSKDNNPEGLT